MVRRASSALSIPLTPADDWEDVTAALRADTVGRAGGVLEQWDIGMLRARLGMCGVTSEMDWRVLCGMTGDEQYLGLLRDALQVEEEVVWARVCNALRQGNEDNGEYAASHICFALICGSSVRLQQLQRAPVLLPSQNVLFPTYEWVRHSGIRCRTWG